MDKAVAIYIQKFSKKYKITTEIDLCKAMKYKGFHKVFRLYQKHTKWLESNVELIHKVSLQYCGKHILQFEVVDEIWFKGYIEEIEKLEYAEVVTYKD